MRYAIALGLLLSLGCGGPTAERPPLPEYTGPLAAPSASGPDFAIDHRITAIHAEGSNAFRALLEKSGETLVVVGLAPHGARAFTLTQRGEEIAFESNMPRELPFPPRYILVDIHRVWLEGLETSQPDGTHEHTLATSEGEERVSDTWADGRIVARRFERVGAPPEEGPILVTYEGGLSPDPRVPAPSRVELDNQRLGYRLVMDELSRSPLED